MSAGEDEVKAKLIEWIEIPWDEIPSELLKTLSESMPRRVVAVIKANRWYTKYQTYLIAAEAVGVVEEVAAVVGAVAAVTAAAAVVVVVKVEAEC